MKKSELGLVVAAIRGGVDVLQLRPDKGERVRDIYFNAKWLKEELAPYEVLLVMNNHVDVAQALGLGLHVGQGDLPFPVARELMGEEAVIGLSLESEEQALEAREWDVDYFGAGVYPSVTKPNYSNLGLEGIGRVKRFLGKAVIGIGGVNRGNVGKVAEYVDGVAVVGELANALNAEAVARELKGAVCFRT